MWWNDPDAVVLTGDLPENEFVFHASVIHARAAWRSRATI
jgi:alpha-galactosidase